MIKAFRKFEQPQARLIIAGKIFDLRNYEKKLKALSDFDLRIKLVAEFIPDDDIQIYLNACDYFVLPYKDITTSGAALLALSFGRPIIAPSIASFPEVVNSVTGILYNPLRKNALNFVMRIAVNKKFSETAIFSYADKFNWDKLSAELVTLYKR